VKQSRIHSELSVEELANARQTVIKAYELALNHVGFDVSSSLIWQEYVDFVKAQPVNDGSSI